MTRVREISVGAEREADEQARSRRQVEQLFSAWQRGVALPNALAPAGRKGVEG